MIRFRGIATIAIGVALLSISAGGVVLALQRPPSSLAAAQPAVRSDDLAVGLGHELCQAGEIDASASRRIINDWLARQTEPVCVGFTVEGQALEQLVSPTWVGPIERGPQHAAEASIVRDGRVWARVSVGIQSRVAPVTPAALVESLRSWFIGGLSVMGGCIAFIRRRRARSVAALWSGAQQRVTQTLDFLAEGIAVLDPRGRVVFANASLTESIELQLADVRGRAVDGLGWTLASPDPADSVSPTTGVPWRQALANPASTVRGQVRWRLSSGEERVLNVSCRSIQSGRRTHGVVAAFDDVSVIEQQRVQLREARDAADHANAAKSVFLANMSHEIRTPIGGVMGTLELLGLTPLRSRQQQYVRAAQGSASALLHLINDILDFSKIEAGRLELAPIDCDLEVCVESALRVVSRVAAEKGLELILNASSIAGLRVVADPERLR